MDFSAGHVIACLKILAISLNDRDCLHKMKMGFFSCFLQDFKSSAAMWSGPAAELGLRVSIAFSIISSVKSISCSDEELLLLRSKNVIGSCIFWLGSGIVYTDAYCVDRHSHILYPLVR